MTDLFKQFICEENDTYSLIFEDNGKVAYAYLLENEVIIGDIWLYNRHETPEEIDWKDKKNLPFLNPAKYIDKSKIIEPVNDISEISIIWLMDYGKKLGDIHIYIRSELIAVLREGLKPGYSSIVLENNPLAKKMSNDIYLLKHFDSVRDQLAGRYITETEKNLIKNKYNGLKYPEFLMSVQMKYKIIGQEFRLNEEDDYSELGVEMSWMTPEDQIEEAFNFYPCKVAVNYGYIPIGKCMYGSGDPYCLEFSKDNIWNIVRVPHDSIVDDKLNIDEIEYVNKLTFFLQKIKN
jgi:hypothetical protein